MAERPRQIVLHSRQVGEIVRLAVPPVEAGEDAEDLGGALGGERRVVGAEALLVEAGVGRPPAEHVALHQHLLEIRGNGDAGVLGERGDVVGGRPQECVLKIEEADAADAGPLRQPHQVGGVVVAHRPVLLRRLQPVEGRLPERHEIRSLLGRGGRAGAGRVRQVPVEQQLHLDRERAGVIGRRCVDGAVGQHHRLRRRLGVEGGEQVDGDAVALWVGRSARRHDLVAEVFRQQQAVGEVARVDARRRQAAVGECHRHGDERADVLGEVGDAAVGLAVAHRRAVGARGRVHQHAAATILRGDALVAAAGGIALQEAAGDTRPAGAVEEVADGERASEALAGGAGGGQRRRTALRPVAEIEGERDVGVGESVAAALGPLDEDDAGRPRLVEAELVDLRRIGQAIEVGVGDCQAAGGIGLYQREGRARHLERRVVGERAQQRPRQRRLAGAEIALEAHHVARRQRHGDVLGEADGRRLVGQRQRPDARCDALHARVHDVTARLGGSGSRAAVSPGRDGKRQITVVPAPSFESIATVPP